MYAKVMRDQFQFRDESIVHMPTGAEFTRVVGNGDSMLIWTGDIGKENCARWSAVSLCRSTGDDEKVVARNGISGLVDFASYISGTKCLAQCYG